MPPLNVTIDPATPLSLQLAIQTEGYTGADLGAVVREAGLAALDEDIHAPQVIYSCCWKAPA